MAQNKKRLTPDDKQYSEQIVKKPTTIQSDESDSITTVAFSQFSNNEESQSYYNSLNQLFYKKLYGRYTDKYGHFIGRMNQGTGSRYNYTSNHTIAEGNQYVGRGPQFKTKFYDKGVLFDISSSKVNNGIEPGTFVLEDNSSGVSNKIYIKDDKYGNLYASGSNYQISQSNTSPSSSDNYVGNIFYQDGVVVLSDTSSYKTGCFYTASGIANKTNYTASWERKKIIRTWTWTCVVDPSEFNFTMNPTILNSGSFEVTKIDDSRKYRPEISGTFKENHYHSMSIVKLPPSKNHIPEKFRKRSFSPYITKIGLMNDKRELLCIAALPIPIKKTKDNRLVFKIQMDF